MTAAKDRVSILRPPGHGDLDMAFHLASRKGAEWLRVLRDGVPDPTQIGVRLWAGRIRAVGC